MESERLFQAYLQGHISQELLNIDRRSYSEKILIDNERIFDNNREICESCKVNL